MKKLIVLMIVLFPVTAWAGAHDKKTRAELCADLNQIGTEYLLMMDSWEQDIKKVEGKHELQNPLTEKEGDTLLRLYKALDKDRKVAAEYAVIYSAFCK